MALKEIPPRGLAENTFSMIGGRWMLITAGDAQKYNTMTASWGGLGVLWGKDVAFAFVRPTRYTYGFIEKQPAFTLSFYPESCREQLQLCGSKSGRDIDKAAACGFTPCFTEAAPYFEQADTVLVCKKLYAQDIDPARFLDPGIAKWYDNDYHRMYVAEITKALARG